MTVRYRDHVVTSVQLTLPSAYAVRRHRTDLDRPRGDTKSCQFEDIEFGDVGVGSLARRSRMIRDQSICITATRMTRPTTCTTMEAALQKPGRRTPESDVAAVPAATIQKKYPRERPVAKTVSRGISGTREMPIAMNN